MMKIFTNKKIRPFKIADTYIHTYPNFPQYTIKEKVWNYIDGTEFHRFYLSFTKTHYKKFICDMITNEKGSFIRVQEKTIHVCDKFGHEYYTYNIKKGV